MLKANANEMINTISGGTAVKPELPPDLDFWLKSMEASSEKLRSKSD